MPKVSRQQVERELEKAINTFDWSRFLGNQKSKLLDSYIALSAQLREGDKLKVEVKEGQSENYENYPVFAIVLYPKGKKEGREVGFVADGLGGFPTTLYPD